MSAQKTSGTEQRQTPPLQVGPLYSCSLQAANPGCSEAIGESWPGTFQWKTTVSCFTLLVLAARFTMKISDAPPPETMKVSSMKRVFVFTVAGVLIAIPVRGIDGKTAFAAEPLASGIDLTNFDKSVRPQDDLFRAVNGAWLAKAQIPQDRSSYGAFAALAEQAEKDLRNHRVLRRCQRQSARLGKAENRGPVCVVYECGAGRATWH